MDIQYVQIFPLSLTEKPPIDLNIFFTDALPITAYLFGVKNWSNWRAEFATKKKKRILFI